MNLSGDLKKNKQQALKVMNQDPFEQIKLALQDEARLVGRSQILRNSSDKKRFYTYKNSNSSKFPDIYDDFDFYQGLLKEWTTLHANLLNNNSNITGSLLIPKKHRQGFDQRASKGRKIRFDVHQKLVNYMVPVPVPNAWSDQKLDEFYSSLLGKI